MEILILLLVVLAVVLLGLAAFGVGSSPTSRVSLGWLGLCALAIVKLIEVM
jgi:predicted carbohydrate-binding protein with CBM5 and CBM33 domain